MIQHLSIQNYILIHNIEVDLTSNFNVFTGETGSGKSMLVDAINFGMGQRSTPNVVGKHGTSARVEILLNLYNDEKSSLVLNELGIPVEEDGTVIISRELFKDGRNVSRINNRSVTLSSVKEFIKEIIDIHSQHETQGLLDSKQHLNILDSYAQNEKLLNQYQETYRSYKKAIKELNDFKTSDINPLEIEEAKKELQQIDTFNPSIEDYEDIQNDLELMNNFEKNQLLYESIINVMRRDEDVLTGLYKLIDNFEDLGHDHLLNQFKDAYFNLEDVYESVVKLEANSNFDAHEYERLQDRIFNYQKLIKKYGSLEGLVESQNLYETLISKSENYEDMLIDHENAVASIKLELDKHAELLRNSRTKAARSLEKDIELQLRELLLENARFVIVFETQEASRDGYDTVVFKVSMNKGINLEPLDKVASGGELSRLMLGIKVIFSKVLGFKTLIFDEIDTGVSGRAGFQIGAKMRELSNNVQVITISHLSSVAACAHAHFAISKSQDDTQTFTDMIKVEDEARVEELALIMSGSQNSESLEAARVLLSKGQAL